MESVIPATVPTAKAPTPWLDLRLIAGVILLIPAIWFSWQTVDGLAARRVMRTDLAEITHARYGILSGTVLTWS